MKRQPPSALEAAIEREDWDGAAVIIVYATFQILELIPLDSLEELVSVLSEEHPHRRKRERRPRRA